MDFLTRLELDSPWTQSEQVVVNHILANPESVLATTPKQLAQTCYVSTSSLYRLLSKLGLDGFSTLQAEISKSLLHREKEKADVDKNFPFSHMQTHYEIIEQLKADYDSTLASQKNLFDLYSLYEACKAMRNAKAIDLYTSAGNLGFFKNFQFQLREIGVNVHMAENDYEQTLMAASAGPDHLAIVLTMEGRSSTIPAIAYALEQSRTPVILLSARIRKRLSKCESAFMDRPQRAPLPQDFLVRDKNEPVVHARRLVRHLLSNKLRGKP